MNTDLEIAYHLRELEVAGNPKSPRHAMPDFLDTDQSILDIGCGIGQTLVASSIGHGKLLVGLDIDYKCLSYGHYRFGFISFVDGSAEQLPFHDGLFDLVISRITLPYTNIEHSLAESYRVMKSNGRVWFTLHSFSKTRKHLLRSIRTFEIKDVIFRSYVILNGLFFHFFGRQFAFIEKRRYESFQTIGGMYRAMKNAGFKDIFVRKKGRQFVCTGSKSHNNRLNLTAGSSVVPCRKGIGVGQVIRSTNDFF